MQSYPKLFTDADKDDQYGPEAAIAEAYGWWLSFYTISQGRLIDFEQIEKLNFKSCLTYLSFEKEKTEIETKRIKNARQNRTY